MTDAIEVTALRKSFGRTRALDGLDLHVAVGEVHGFLGPNGAGKTTTIRVLLGLLRADGALALGLSWAATGWIFAAVAGVTAALSESARTARGMAIAVLGLSYLLRAEPGGD